MMLSPAGSCQRAGLLEAQARAAREDLGGVAVTEAADKVGLDGGTGKEDGIHGGVVEAGHRAAVQTGCVHCRPGLLVFRGWTYGSRLVLRVGGGDVRTGADGRAGTRTGFSRYAWDQIAMAPASATSSWCRAESSAFS